MKDMTPEHLKVLCEFAATQVDPTVSENEYQQVGAALYYLITAYRFAVSSELTQDAARKIFNP